MDELSTPVSIFIYNRYEITLNLFEILKKIKPKKLIISADGPKDINDLEKCLKTRGIFQSIPWDCQVEYNYRKKNIGCNLNLIDGISRTFKNYDKAIFLEDDCHPNLSFFKFCENLLDKYENDKRISIISGVNFMHGINNKDVLYKNYSYYFSNYNLIWGWATWKRTWNNFDFESKHENDYLESNFFLSKFNFYQRLILKDFYSVMIQNKNSVWDQKFSLKTLSQNQYSIIPSKNLVTNVGGGDFATNNIKISKINFQKNYKMDFPLNHPAFFYTDKIRDAKIFKLIFYQNPFYFFPKLFIKFILSRLRLLDLIFKK